MDQLGGVGVRDRRGAGGGATGKEHGTPGAARP